MTRTGVSDLKNMGFDEKNEGFDEKKNVGFLMKIAGVFDEKTWGFR